MEIKAGMKFTYNDGRPGHENVHGTVLLMVHGGFVAQFEDRAQPTVIMERDPEWMQHIQFEPYPEIDSLDWFDAIATILMQRGWMAETTNTGGGIICIVVNADEHNLYFGTSNETWGADIYLGDQFQDGQSISTFFSTDIQNPEACAIAIESAVEKFLITERIEREDVIRDIEDAMWAEVVKKFPEAKSGDFPPDASFHLTRAVKNAIKLWLRYNLPEVATLEDVEHVKERKGQS